SDFLSHVLVREAASGAPVTLRAEDRVEDVRAWLASGAPGTSHQGFPVLDGTGLLAGVLTRRDLLGGEAGGSSGRDPIRRPQVVVSDAAALRRGTDRMVDRGVGRLPVLRPEDHALDGYITRSDILGAHRRRLRESREARASLSLRGGRAA